MKRLVMALIFIALFSLLAISCGGGGGGEDRGTSSNWNEMTWDQGQWS